MSILIVDDSLDSRILLKTILEAAGYTGILTAESAAEAFKYLNDQCERIDLILLDIMLPDTDGIELCSSIKAKKILQDIPIIMVTAKTDTSDLQLAFAAGAIDYVTKPFNKIELLTRLRSVLRLKHEIERRKAREKELLEVTRLLHEANQILKRLSFLDGLTGINNRRRFDEYLEHEWRRALRDGTTLSFIMSDIDYFKDYNDTYGHLSGDDCLKKVAGAFNSAVNRQSDLVARYGGEEFAVILPATQLDGAVVVAERIRKSVEALNIQHLKSPIGQRVTVSLGVAAMVPYPDSSPTELIAASDQALFRAKSAGKNQVKT